jgi:hypothetical protein
MLNIIIFPLWLIITVLLYLKAHVHRLKTLPATNFFNLRVCTCICTHLCAYVGKLLLSLSIFKRHIFTRLFIHNYINFLIRNDYSLVHQDIT